MRRFLNLVLIASLLLTSLPLQAHARAGRSLSLPAGAGLYRSTLQITHPTRLARLDTLGVKVLRSSATTADVLASEEQLATLARLRYEPSGIIEFSLLVEHSAAGSPALAGMLSPLALNVQAALGDRAQMGTLVQTMSPEQVSAAAALTTVDDDDDGLTNTQEAWWCTDPLNRDSDGDGKTDGSEIAALKDWLGNRRAAAPGETPWASWPFNSSTCPDKDKDSIPNLAELELGLNMDLESTDRDKFDDGQELFGVTYCPGGDLSCGYGDLPRSSDSGYVGAVMPSWVLAPGSHPLVAAFPLPNVEVLPSSFHVQTVTVVTTDHVIGSGTEKTYSTAETSGVSVTNTKTKTRNNWKETSEATTKKTSGDRFMAKIPTPFADIDFPSIFKSIGTGILDTGKFMTAYALAQAGCTNFDVNASYNAGYDMGVNFGGGVSGGLSDFLNADISLLDMF